MKSIRSSLLPIALVLIMSPSVVLAAADAASTPPPADIANQYKILQEPPVFSQRPANRLAPVPVEPPPPALPYFLATAMILLLLVHIASKRMIARPAKAIHPPEKRNAANEEIQPNPFQVLSIGPSASRADVERAGQRLLAMLEIGSASAQHYATPFGPRIRTADMVRQALASLRNPGERLVHEFWSIPADPVSGNSFTVPAADPPAWAEAMQALGWRPVRSIAGDDTPDNGTTTTA